MHLNIFESFLMLSAVWLAFGFFYAFELKEPPLTYRSGLEEAQRNILLLLGFIVFLQASVFILNRFGHIDFGYLLVFVCMYVGTVPGMRLGNKSTRLLKTLKAHN